MNARHGVLAVALLAIVVGVASTPRLPQDPAYHDFADRRSCGPITNCFDVLSNIPFALVGLAGLAALRRRRAFGDDWERWPYVALFAGTALTAFGSGYYHLAPDNARLVWDRLPMTIGFMGFLAAAIAERIGLGVARRLLPALLVAGAASVGYWYWSETRGAGDLRPYLVVQFGSLVTVVLLLALYPPRYTHTWLVVLGLGAYALAKVFELGDRPIFEAIGVSGHSLKHVAAAAGVGCIAATLLRRTRRQP